MIVKIGTSRQIVIPKKAFAALRLAAGDYLEVLVRDETLVMVPKTLVDKDHASDRGRRQSDGNSQTQED
jgi:AbrB family looped-hinge helix DNA binding protein